MPVRSVRPSVLVAVLAVGLLAAGDFPAASELKPRTLEAWNRYVAATEARIDRELASPEGFLVLDFQPAVDARKDRAAIGRGEIVVEKMKTRDADGDEIHVPDGSIQHWRGAVLIRGLTLDRLMEALESGDTLLGQKDVVDWRVLDRGPGRLRTFIRLRRESIVTVTYDTEHEVVLARVSGDRATSRSAAVRIAEIEHAGRPDERARPPGNDAGYLWRLNGYWRYQQTDDGVIVEVESVTLSRGIPLFVRPFFMIVDRIARGSVESTLDGLRANLGRSAAER